MKNKNILVWLLVVLAVVGAVAIGYTYRGTFLQGKMGRPVSGSCDGKGCPAPVSGPVSGPQVNDAINRAEFAKLLAVAYLADNEELSPDGNDCFSDIESGAWYAEYVCFLAEKDIVQGYADSTFKPANKVLRAEAAKTLLNAYSISGGGFGGLEPPAGNPYTDVSENDWWYQSVYDGAAYLKLFDVKPWVGAKFYPGKTLSKGRAQLWINNFKKVLPVN